MTVDVITAVTVFVPVTVVRTVGTTDVDVLVTVEVIVGIEI